MLVKFYGTQLSRLVLQWAVASVFILFVGMSMAELASAAPTSGGLYFWTHSLSSPRWRNLLSWIVGCQFFRPWSSSCSSNSRGLHNRHEHHRIDSIRGLHRLGLCCPSYGRCQDWFKGPEFRAYEWTAFVRDLIYPSDAVR